MRDTYRVSDDRPVSARRIAAERKARGWSQSAAIAALRGHSPEELPSDESLLREWKRWEAGETMPQRYRPLIAAVFGTIEHSMFPQPSRYNRDREVAEVSGLDMVELLQRLRTSDLDGATLDALRITVERLCCEYPHLPSNELVVEGRRWLEQLVGLQSQRLNLPQHREVLNLAGWLALLIGCVEYDQGDRRASETTREVALSLGNETGNPDIVGWVHEMRAWIALTTGDYRGAIYASRAGIEAAGGRAVAAQLASQGAKAWARVGDRRQTEVALDQGAQHSGWPALPGPPGQPFRGRPGQVRLLRHGLLQGARREPARPNPRRRCHPHFDRLRWYRTFPNADGRSPAHPRSGRRPRRRHR